MKKLLVLVAATIFIFCGCIKNTSTTSSSLASSITSIETLLTGDDGVPTKCGYEQDVTITQSTQAATANASKKFGGTLISGRWTNCLNLDKLQSYGFTCYENYQTLDFRFDGVETQVNPSYISNPYSIVRVTTVPESTNYNSGYDETLLISNTNVLIIAGRTFDLQEGKTKVTFDPDDTLQFYKCIRGAKRAN